MSSRLTGKLFPLAFSWLINWEKPFQSPNKVVNNPSAPQIIALRRSSSLKVFPLLSPFQLKRVTKKPITKPINIMAFSTAVLLAKKIKIKSIIPVHSVAKLLSQLTVYWKCMISQLLTQIDFYRNRMTKLTVSVVWNQVRIQCLQGIAAYPLSSNFNYPRSVRLTHAERRCVIWISNLYLICDFITFRQHLG